MEAQEVSRCWEWETYVHNPATVTHHVSPDTCQDNVSTGNVSSPRSDSGLNSLEYWDYSVELECITGQQDLQLAAELGKTLLERNKELEISLKHQQSVIDDQNMEIEYLTKQATALRDMNESRLKIYEQLELSMVDLERNNLRMTEEGILDKERIKTLSSTVQTLELKCEELQRCLDDVILRRTGSDRDGERTTLEGSLKREDPLLARRDYTCQICTSATINNRNSSIAEDDATDNNNDEGRDSPSTGTQESGYGSTCTDSLGYRDTDNDLDTCDTGDSQDNINHNQSQNRDRSLINGNHLGAILEAEEVIRLNQEISCLREEIERRDRQVKELEEQMSLLISENQRLETVRNHQQVANRSSSVEQEVQQVLAVERIAQGRLCSHCLRRTKDHLDSTELYWLVVNTAQYLGSEFCSAARRSLNIVLSRLLNSPSSLTWLDRWLVIVTLSTIVLGCFRAFVNTFLYNL